MQVDLQDLGEVGVREGFGRVAALDAGAVDEDAELVAVGEDAGDEGGDVAGRGEVGGVEVGLAVEGFDGGFGGLVGGVALRCVSVSGYLSPVSWFLVAFCRGG